MKPDSQQLALLVVPPGARPAVVELRTRIAEMIDVAVRDALEWQREHTLSDEVKQLESEVKARVAAMSAARSNIEKERNALEKERVAFRAVVAGHCDFLSAVEAWMAWCGGAGEIEEQRQLWSHVVSRWAEYQSLRPDFVIQNARVSDPSWRPEFVRPNARVSDPS